MGTSVIYSPLSRSLSFYVHADKAQIVSKLCQKSSKWRHKNEGLSISFLGIFFHTSPLSSSFLWHHVSDFWATFSLYVELHFYLSLINKCLSNCLHICLFLGWVACFFNVLNANSLPNPKFYCFILNAQKETHF